MAGPKSSCPVKSACWLALVVLLLSLGTFTPARALENVKRGMAEVNGTRLSYEIAGKGRAVVLIHGGLVDSRLWDDQFKELARHYRVLRYDLRGFGKSDFPAGPFSHVEDLYALLRFLKIEKASLVGLSLGGMIAMDFTLEYPLMVQSLVLAASGLRGLQIPRNEQSVAIYRVAATEGRDKAIELWFAHPFFASGRKTPSYEERIRRMLVDNFRYWGPTKEPIQVNWPKALTSERLSEINKPTLVILGEEDHANISLIADALAAKIPGARKVVMKGVSHHLNMEKPEEFNRLLMDFLRGK